MRYAKRLPCKTKGCFSDGLLIAFYPSQIAISCIIALHVIPHLVLQPAAVIPQS